MVFLVHSITLACHELRTNVTINEFCVPQSSNLVSLSSLIYINDLPNILSSLHGLLANDTCLLIQAALFLILEN